MHGHCCLGKHTCFRQLYVGAQESGPGRIGTAVIQEYLHFLFCLLNMLDDLMMVLASKMYSQRCLTYSLNLN